MLDIALEKKNRVIAKRAFSSDYKDVGKYATEFLQALEKEGVLGCGKHFPGHGATIEDSHHELPVLSVDEETLKTRELLPFKELIACGLSMVMTAHVCIRS